MFAVLLEHKGWVLTDDDKGFEIAYTYWNGEKILAYVAGADLMFHTWLFGTPELTERHPKCYQYPDKPVCAYSVFSSWIDAKSWVTTVLNLNNEEVVENAVQQVSECGSETV